MKVLNTEIQNYINANLNADLHSLLLKKSPFPNISMHEIVQQIKGKNVALKKFPFLLKEGIVFPPNLNMEQSSSEFTAQYKASLVSGKKMADLTAGFGIDSFFFSEKFQETTLVEQNPELLAIVENNWKILGKKAKFKNQKLEDFLTSNPEFFDLIYLDPARRDLNRNKVFLLEDLSPNILEIQEKLRPISSKILIKLSPLIDISYLLSVLKNLSEIHIVAIKNDVKELLVIMDTAECSNKTRIQCINLQTDESSFEFFIGEEKNAQPTFSETLQYLYIPNNTLLKAGVFNLISERYNISKLHPNTHLYTSEKYIDHFPGRVFEIEKTDSGSLIKGDFYNIISKNHPLKPEEIKKKYKIKDGGEKYLIFTQDIKGKVILKSK